jgi:uncharacterized protein YggE
MKKYFSMICLMLLFVVPTAYAELPEFPFVFAEGEATMEVPPDIATISFSVEQFDEIGANALQVVQNRSAEIIEYLISLKIQEEDIIGYEISKRSVRERNDYTELKILGYEFSRSFSVKVKDLDKYEMLVKKLLSLENIVNIESEFNRSDREKIETELVSKSCQNARKNAELMANGFDAKLGDVYAISKSGFENIGTQFSAKRFFTSDSLFMSTLASVNDDLLFIPSTITIRNTVTAIFRLGN